MLRWLRWKLAKSRFAAAAWNYPPDYKAQSTTRRLNEFQPNSAAYSRLAHVWDELAGWCTPKYGLFLDAAKNYYGQPITRVLDLACGTGLMTRQFADRCPSVVGLDISEPMLSEARRRSANLGIRYCLGDFRNFRVDGVFDAVACGADSLNYVQTTDELKSVFRCVHDHMSPGGLFLFDVLDDRGCRYWSQFEITVTIGADRVEMFNFYDVTSHIIEARVAFHDSTIEGHRRIPIETDDVHAAASYTGFEVAERFEEKITGRQFYVLRK